MGDSRNSPDDLATDKLFTGQRLDDSGLYYYNARYYDSTIGRFISADSIVPDPSNPQSLNRYSYCINNPLKYVDPSGNLFFIPVLIAIGVGALIGGATDAAIQVGDNLVHGRGAFDNFSWTDVGISAGIGGATSAIGMIPGVSKAISAVTKPITKAAGKLIGGITSRATPSLERLATEEAGSISLAGRGAHIVGNAGEIAAGITKNTEHIKSVLGTAKYRVPDVLNRSAGIIGEVKNVAKLSYTKQLR